MEKNKKFELVSALIDGALVSEQELQQALDFLLNDTDCQKKWEEYHVIGTSLKSSLVKNMPQTLSPPLDIVVKNQPKKANNIFKIGLSLAAALSVLGVATAFFWKQSNEFTPDYNVMMSSLATGNSKIAMLTFMADNAYEVIDDAEYTRQQRSLENNFLRTHENSGNTGGIIRVAFPKHKESI